MDLSFLQFVERKNGNRQSGERKIQGQAKQKKNLRGILKEKTKNLLREDKSVKILPAERGNSVQNLDFLTSSDQFMSNRKEKLQKLHKPKVFIFYCII